MLDFLKRWTQPERSAPVISAVSASETGQTRSENQDHVLMHDEARVYCVADGLGGGSEGAHASEIVCRELRMMLNAVEPTYAARIRAAQRAIVEANAVIHAYAQEKGYRQMGSTVAILVCDETDATHATVVHVGDSRVYRVRGGLARAMTRDHSVGFELGDFAGKNAERLRDRSHPLSHVLTRAVGTSPAVQAETREIDVAAGDRFVLCTDGVHDVITDARLAIFAGGGTLAAARMRLAAEIEKAGSPDNYSFVLVEVG